MKKRRLDIILIIMLLIGAGFIIYPIVSSKLNEQKDVEVITDYSGEVESANGDDLEAIWKAALDYNARLAADPNAFYLPDRVEGYDETLRVGGSEVMAHISIPKMNITIPIYHTINESALQIGIGHMEGTSLPTGGEGNNCVLMGHRGLPNAKLFTDLDKLEIGDRFTVEVLDKKLHYEVDDISVTDPKDYEKYKSVPGEDYCTLVTCTPYGLNTERLIVRGHRIALEND